MSSNSNDLIGMLCLSRFQYFNSQTNRPDFKRRPVLVIGVEKDVTPCDITVFPVSKVSLASNISEDYDHTLTVSAHPELNLAFDPSYVRTHKVSTIHSRDLVKDIGSVKDLYPTDYQSIMEKFEQFTNGLLEKVLTQK